MWQRLKGALMFPAGNTTANANANATPSEEPAFPVMDSVWLCQDVLGSCPKFIEGAEHGGYVYQWLPHESMTML